MRRISGSHCPRNSGIEYSLLSMVRITPEVIPWLTVCNLNTFSPYLLALAGNTVFKCLRCQRLARKTKQQCHTNGYDLDGSPGEKVCLNFVGPLKPIKKGHTSLLTIVDVYTRWFTAWPVKSQKAEMVIKHLIMDYFPDSGVPSVVHFWQWACFYSPCFPSRNGGLWC